MNDKSTKQNVIMQRPVDDKSTSGVHSLYEWAEAIVFALVLVVLLFSFVCRTVGVDGQSMMNTLLDGERLLVTSYPITVEYEDIVIVNRYIQEPLVKRVIALEGDTLWIDEETGVIYRNNQPLDEKYIAESTRSEPNRDNFLPTDKNNAYEVPKDHVYVMGDNRNHSMDSREMGPYNKNDIIGKAFFRIFPFERFGGI